MPPKKQNKKGGRKGKGGDDSDLEWESSLKATTQETVSKAENEEEAMMNVDEEGNDLGGLMSAIASNSRGKKNKGKKGKKGRGGFDEDEEEDAAAILAALEAKAKYEDEVPVKKKASKKAFSFAALAGDDDEEEEEEEEVVVIPVVKIEKNDKNKKKSKKKEDEEVEDAAMFDEEKEEEVKKEEEGKRGGKKGKKEDGFEDEMELLAAEIEKNAKVVEKEVKVVETREEEGHIKSKKEKERERKERQKQAKKQQQMQGVSVLNGTNEPVATTSTSTGSASTTTTSTSTSATTSASASKRKGPAGVAALREALAARKAAEEEARRKEEEEKRRAEEEERRRQAEEEKKEEARLRRKERERAKKEELRRSGRLQTPAQRAQQQQAQMKLQAMLAAGVVVEGLREGEREKKRVVYGKKKKKEIQKEIVEIVVEKEIVEKEIQKEIQEIVVENKLEEHKLESSEDDWEAHLEEEEEENQSIQEENQSIQQEKSIQQETIQQENQSIQHPHESSSESSSEDESENDENDESDESENMNQISSTQKLLLIKKEEAALKKHQRIQAALAARSKDNLRSPICCILGHVDTGKCFGIDTPLILSDGSTKTVQTIVPSDSLMGDDGSPRSIVPRSIISGTGPLFRVCPSIRSGHAPFVCNDAHILVLINLKRPWVECRKSSHASYSVCQLKINHSNIPFIHSTHGYSRYSLALAALPKWEPLIWHIPFIDFLSVNKKIASFFAIYKPSSGIIYPPTASNFHSILSKSSFLDPSPSWLITHSIASNNSCICHSCNSNAIAIHSTLIKISSSTNAIPDAIMRSSNPLRLAALAGFIDTLATYHANNHLLPHPICWTIDSSSSNLISDIKHLARSLGLRSYTTSLKNIPVLVISGALMSSLNPYIRNKQKSAPESTPDQYQLYLDNSSSFEIESLGIGQYFGFTVSGPNSRFLLGDFTVTHNTKLLDKIRQTNVQEGEAGGITQQIGATYFPMDAIIQKTALLHKDAPPDYRVPGLLVIDTPGHESFTNLRSRGSSLCNIAVLVVDIVHGLEPQTIESIGLLRQRKTPFIVALNKIDRLFDWQPTPNYPTRDTLALQKPHVLKEFHERTNKIIVEFAEQGLNACLYWENKNMGKYVSLVPTSAITGEGVPDLLHLLVDLTQTRMTERLMYLSELECTVLEVKVVEGLGTTIDVVLSNGVLNEGDRICVCGLNGPIVTNIRALLTPQPMRELRVKSAYVHHKSVKASLGVKISAPDLEKAIAGSRLMVIGPDDDEDDIKEEVMGDLTSLLSSIDKSGKGVCVQASTLGSLEALLVFLKSSNIPVSGINIGPVHKKDVIRASIMLERAPEYAQLLAFDVPVDKDAADLAQEMGVKVFTANIIYHLFDAFTAYMKDLEEQKRKDAAPSAVFPCLLRIVPGAIFNKRSPIIIGVDVVEGNLKIGTPLCVVNKDTQTVISLGKVMGIEQDHKPRQEVKRGGPSVAIRIESPTYDPPKMYGRHFTEENEVYSRITRASIDVLKTMFRNDLSRDEWALVVKLKKILKIE